MFLYFGFRGCYAKTPFSLRVRLVPQEPRERLVPRERL